MLILLSPAKKLDVSGDKPTYFSEPKFTEEAEKLINVLRKYKPAKLSKLMGISPALADLNYLRYQEWEKGHDFKNAKQAILTFTGEVYAGLNASSFSHKEFKYAQDHLRLLSGLYGILKPMDLIHAYRLEMGTKLKNGRKKNLYEFWGDKIVNEINSVTEINKDEAIVNLASNEYFKSVNKKKLATKVITPVFKDFNNGTYKTVMVYAKKARGMMAAFVIENQIEKPADLIAFDTDGYYYNKELSTDAEMVFYRG
jgi:uncharacterized protein